MLTRFLFVILMAGCVEPYEIWVPHDETDPDPLTDTETTEAKKPPRGISAGGHKPTTTDEFCVDPVEKIGRPFGQESEVNNAE